MEESLRCGLLDDWIKNSVFGFEFPFRRPLIVWSKIEAVIPLINNDANIGTRHTIRKFSLLIYDLSM